MLNNNILQKSYNIDVKKKIPSEGKFHLQYRKSCINHPKIV